MKKREKGQMVLSGSLVVSGPGIIERLAAGEEVEFDDGMGEFFLQVKPGNELKVETFSPLVWANDADVTINNDAMEHGEIADDVCIYIKGLNEREVGVNISIAQAEALLHILSNFITAYKACDELEKTWKVNTA